MTTATKAGGAVLPAEVVKRLESSLDWMLKGMHTGPLVSALDYRLIIGWLGQIDELRAEVERLRVVEFNSAVQFRDAVQPLREEVERLKRERWVAIQRELDALKAKQIDVEAVMRLADAFAGAVCEFGIRGFEFEASAIAAREALRAELTKGSN